MGRFRKKRGLFVILTILLLAFSVSAQDNLGLDEEPELAADVVVDTLTGSTSTTGYDWLADESLATTEEIEDQSLAILALLGTSGKETQTAALLERLNDHKDELEPCWPRGDCTIKDTALATLALQKAGRTVDAERAYLQEALIAGLQRSGEWRIQIESGGVDGTCTVERGDGQNKREFTIEGQEIKGTVNKFYIDIRADLRDRALLATPNNQVKVDCTTLGEDISGGNIVISLVYAKSATELFLLQSVTGGEATLTLPNGCFGQEQDSSRCNYESTLYTTWALIEMGEKLLDMGTHTYLESNLGTDDFHKAVLVRALLIDGTTNSQSFMNALKDAQRVSDGSWKSGDIFTSAFATFALTPSEFQDNAQNGRLFLERKQEEDGSWRESIKDTAMALIALKGDLSTGFIGESSEPTEGPTSLGVEEICNDVIDNDGDFVSDCGDIDCTDHPDCICENGELDTGEEGVDCGGTCPLPCEGEGISFVPEGCIDDFECGVGEECIGGECVLALDGGLPPPDLDGDGEKKSRLGTFILIIVILLVLGGGAFFYLKYVKTGKVKLFRKKAKGPTFEEFKSRAAARPTAHPTAKPSGRGFPKRPSRPTRAGKKSAEEEALERSLKEAEKLLKKK